jgi:hypothetical protein
MAETPWKKLAARQGTMISDLFLVPPLFGLLCNRASVWFSNPCTAVALTKKLNEYEYLRSKF